MSIVTLVVAGLVAGSAAFKFDSPDAFQRRLVAAAWLLLVAGILRHIHWEVTL